MKKLALLLLSSLFLSSLNAQIRYQDEVFTQVTEQYPVVYGANYSVLFLNINGHISKQPLVARAFMPTGDTETNRPCVVLAHTGNFLPWANPATGQTVNGSCGGTINDSSIVEIARRLARRGYVALIADYRTGWNPLDPNELGRRAGLINAAYRGVQDMRTCARYLRRSVAQLGNPFGIDPNKLCIWGQGTGGYISLACATLTKYSKIINTSEPGKFILPGGIPMIIESYNGDIHGFPPTGLTVCRVDSLYNLGTGFPVGDTLCIPNHPGYGDDFAVAVNMGGALGDKAWLDAQTPPIISFHVPLDPYAPCGDGLVVVPGFNLPVVNVTGSCGVAGIADGLGINAVFHAKTYTYLDGGYNAYALSVNGGAEAFLPFLRPATDSAPWEWNGFVPTGVTGCNLDATIARKTIDSIMGYACPRLCLAMNLGGTCKVSDTREPLATNIALDVAPNPASGDMSFSTNEVNPMLSVELFDLNGSLVRSAEAVRGSQYTLRRGDLPNGMYIAKVRFEQGVVGKKVVFE